MKVTTFQHSYILTVLLGAMLPAAALAQDRIPGFELKNLEGETVSLRELQGERLTVIDIWATWCAPCLRSIPALVEMAADFEDHGVRFVGISVDSPRNVAKVKPFARSLGVTYPVLLDLNSEVMARLNVVGVPTLIIVDADREIVYLHEGYRPGDDREIRAEIERLLARSSESR